MGLIHRVVADVDGLVAAVAVPEPASPAVLYPEEFAAVRDASEKRQGEYAAVRQCARLAFERLGLPPVAIVTGPDRAPRWPDGVVGSFTHTPGCYAAVVALGTYLAGVGVDAEPDAALPDGVGERVLSAAERHRAARLPGDGPAWDRLTFCAKEAVYKACQPLLGGWLGFDEAEVAVEPDGTLQAHLLTRAPEVAGVIVRDLPGRWASDGRHLLAAVTIRS